MKSLQIGKLTPDPRDLAILKCLQSDPRLGISELARQVELSAPTVRERLQRFHFAPDRARFAVAHANVRTILGSYLHQPAADVRFSLHAARTQVLAGRDLETIP